MHNRGHSQWRLLGLNRESSGGPEECEKKAMADRDLIDWGKRGRDGEIAEKHGDYRLWINMSIIFGKDGNY